MISLQINKRQKNIFIVLVTVLVLSFGYLSLSKVIISTGTSTVGVWLKSLIVNVLSMYNLAISLPIVVAVAAAFALFFKKKLAETLFPALICIIFVLYSFGLVNKRLDVCFTLLIMFAEKIGTLYGR